MALSGISVGVSPKRRDCVRCGRPLRKGSGRYSVSAQSPCDERSLKSFQIGMELSVLLPTGLPGIEVLAPKFLVRRLVCVRRGRVQRPDMYIALIIAESQRGSSVPSIVRFKHHDILVPLALLVGVTSLSTFD